MVTNPWNCPAAPPSHQHAAPTVTYRSWEGSWGPWGSWPGCGWRWWSSSAPAPWMSWSHPLPPGPGDTERASGTGCHPSGSEQETLPPPPQGFPTPGMCLFTPHAPSPRPGHSPSWAAGAAVTSPRGAPGFSCTIRCTLTSALATPLFSKFQPREKSL